MQINPVSAQCPYCGETIELFIEMLVELPEADQSYIEDCSVCCRPIQVHPFVDAYGTISARLYHENEVPGA